MIRLALLLALLAGPAVGQPYQSAGPHGAPDEFELEVVSDAYAVIRYSNSADQTSAAGPRLLDDEDFAVSVRVTPGGADIGFAERLTVIAPEGWTAVPEVIEVMDGDSGIVELFRGEFLGM